MSGRDLTSGRMAEEAAVLDAVRQAFDHVGDDAALRHDLEDLRDRVERLLNNPNGSE